MNRRSLPPHLTGRMVEDKACEFLRRHGYRIICRNYRSRYGEIDIVATLGSLLVFIEVRYRRHGSQVLPQESVTRAKAKNLRLAIRDFVYRHGNIAKQYDGIRVDLVCASGGGEVPVPEFTVIQGIIEF